MSKNDLKKIESVIKKENTIAMLAPSFVSEFSYPGIVVALKKLGFKKVVELTFGAKMVNREYQQLLKSKKMFISTACPGIVEFIKKEYPQYVKNLMPVDSPMVATAKICKKGFPKYKTIFISPCNFKKQEAEFSKYVDFVIDYQQLHRLLNENKIRVSSAKGDKIQIFDSFYNDYTKIYPLAGGLSKTANLKGVLKKNETVVIDGVINVKKFLDQKNKDEKIRFLDINFCKGGCLGGPNLSNSVGIVERKKRLTKYSNYSKKASIAKNHHGRVSKASGINFGKEY